jgi:hypothetical protein
MKWKENEFPLVFAFCVSKRWTKSHGPSKVYVKDIISYNSSYKLNPMMYSSEGRSTYQNISIFHNMK